MVSILIHSPILADFRDDVIDDAPHFFLEAWLHPSSYFFRLSRKKVLWNHEEYMAFHELQLLTTFHHRLRMQYVVETIRLEILTFAILDFHKSKSNQPLLPEL